MPDGPRQLALRLPAAPRLGREDFLVTSSNADVVAALDRWPDWPDAATILVGPPGAGKTHVAGLWAERAGAATLPRARLRDDAVPGLAARGAVVVEDCDRVGTGEAALFHLLNALRERGGFALLTAASEPLSWGIGTPDLLSRLRRAALLRLDAPDDALVRAVLVKLFDERGIMVDPGVVAYLAARVERSIQAIRALVDALDREGLERGRPITRALAAEVLRAAPEGEAPCRPDGSSL